MKFGRLQFCNINNYVHSVYIENRQKYYVRKKLNPFSKQPNI